MLSRQELAKAIWEVSHRIGEFRLRSGAVSNEYFDKYLFETEPSLLLCIAHAMTELLPSNVDALAGLELGGVPVATALSQATGLPALFVRKKAKEYGTCKLVEGGTVEGRSVVIVEDVVTSGGQIALSARELRDLGADLSHVLCVVDREAGAADNLSKEHLELRPLFTMAELKRVSHVVD